MNLFVLLFVLFVFYCLYSYISKFKKISIYEPKGPPFLPIIGNLHQLGELPHKTLLDMTNQYGNVFRIWMGDYYTVVVSDPIIIKQIVVNNNDNFLNRTPNPTFGLFTNNYEDLVGARDGRWRHNRKLVSNSFSKSKLRTFSSYIEKQANQFVNIMYEFQKSNQPFPPMKYCRKYALNIIFSIVFSGEIPYEEGVNEGKFGELIGPLDAVVKRAAGSLIDYVRILHPLFYGVKKFTGTEMDPIYDFVAKVYDEHLNSVDYINPRDLLDILIADSDERDRNSVIAMVIDFVVAGSDTSATTIDWFLLLMANHPDIQEKVGKEILDAVGVNGKVSLNHKSSTPYLNAAIKETLRLKTIAPIFMPRETKESILLNDEVFIREGAQILIYYYGLSRSEKHWSKPEEFQPERFLSDESRYSDYFIPFGAGPRNCVGMNLAYDELYIGIGNIMSNFKVSPYECNKIDDTELFGLTLKPKEYLLKLDKRC